MPTTFFETGSISGTQATNAAAQRGLQLATLDQAAKPEELSAQSRAWLGANVKVVPYLFKFGAGMA